MVKYFCDRCGKEVPTTRAMGGQIVPVLHDVRIPDKKMKNDGSFSTRSLNVCDECKKESDKLNDLITDFRFKIFKDYMKGFENNAEGYERTTNSFGQESSIWC